MAKRATRISPSSRPQQNSPFLRLPVELRIAIYDVALNHIIEDRVAQTQHDLDHGFRYNPGCLKFTGALAIPHTSYALRIESIGVMKSLAKAKVKIHRDAARRPRNTPMGSKERLKETLARSEAWGSSFSIVLGLDQMAVDQKMLLLWCSSIPWSELNRAGKRCVVRECYNGLSREKQACLDEATAGFKEVNFWPALVKVFDGRVERGEMEDFKGVAGFRAAFGAAS